MDRFKYSYHRYNRFDVVRVNAVTVGAVMFLCRHLLAFIVIGLAFSRTPPDSRGAFNGLFEPIYMLADIPAVMVFLAMLARHPESGRMTRLIWRGGPWLLLASAGIFLTLLVNRMGADPAQYGWPLWAAATGTVAASAYVFLSPYARDLFRQFPDPGLAEDGTRKS